MLRGLRSLGLNLLGMDRSKIWLINIRSALANSPEYHNFSWIPSFAASHPVFAACYPAHLDDTIMLLPSSVTPAQAMTDAEEATSPTPTKRCLSAASLVLSETSSIIKSLSQEHQQGYTKRLSKHVRNEAEQSPQK